MNTEQETHFYERLANDPFWRVRCGSCGCPKWAHMNPRSKALTSCGCGKCPNFTYKKGKTK